MEAGWTEGPCAEGPAWHVVVMHALPLIYAVYVGVSSPMRGRVALGLDVNESNSIGDARKVQAT